MRLNCAEPLNLRDLYMGATLRKS